MGASAATAALAVAGVSRPRRSRAQAEPITYWMRDSGETIILPIIDAWNAENEIQIEATVTPAAQFVQKFAAAVAGGEAPDLIAVDLIYMPAFSAAGQMTDITDLARSLPFYDTLSPPHMRLGTYEDRIYSLPFSADGSFLAYSRNLFEQAGLDPDAPPRPPGRRSANTRGRLPAPVTASTASTSPAPVRAATRSPCSPISGPAAAMC